MRILKNLHTDYDFTEINADQAGRELSPQELKELRRHQLVVTAEATYMVAPDFVKPSASG